MAVEVEESQCEYSEWRHRCEIRANLAREQENDEKKSRLFWRCVRRGEGLIDCGENKAIFVVVK